MPYHSAFAVPVPTLDIMVVDDSESMRRLYRTCLAAFGITSPRMFDSSREALRAMNDLPPDLVIIDWRMGPPNGLDFLRHMRRIDNVQMCLTAAIMVTGHASAAFVKTAIRAGAQQFLVKPVSPRLLYERIHWITNDARELEQKGGTYVIEGVEDRLRWHERSLGVEDHEERDVVEL